MCFSLVLLLLLVCHCPLLDKFQYATETNAWFQPSGIWQMHNLKVFLWNPVFTLSVLTSATRLPKWSFMSHGNVCLVFGDSHECARAWPLNRCDIWPTGCPGVAEVTWVSTSGWSHMIANIRCLIFYVMSKIQKHRTKGWFLFSKPEISRELQEQGHSERLNLQDNLCLAFVKNCLLLQKQKAHENKVQ